MPVDPSGGPGRHPYVPFYGHKGPDGAHLSAVMSQRPPYAGDYGHDAMYNSPGYMMPGPGYMGPQSGKPGHFSIQDTPVS